MQMLEFRRFPISGGACHLRSHPSLSLPATVAAAARLMIDDERESECVCFLSVLLFLCSTGTTYTCPYLPPFLSSLCLSLSFLREKIKIKTKDEDRHQIKP